MPDFVVVVLAHDIAAFDIHPKHANFNSIISANHQVTIFPAKSERRSRTTSPAVEKPQDTRTHRRRRTPIVFWPETDIMALVLALVEIRFPNGPTALPPRLSSVLGLFLASPRAR
jgi:hypothetical protein